MEVDELFSKHQAGLLRYLTRYAGDPDVAADAAQDVYLRFMKSPPRNNDNVRAWLFTVATNVVRDGWKRDGRAERLLDTPELAPTATPALDPQAGLESDHPPDRGNWSLVPMTDR